MPIILDSDFSIDLCTLEEVREHGSYQDVDTAQDEIIPRLITALSRSMLAIREFRPALASNVRVIEIDPGETVYSVHPYDLQAVSAVVIDDDFDTELSLEAGAFRPAGWDPESQTYGELELATTTPATSSFSRRTLTITGTWGFPEVPEDVNEACQLAVLMYLRRDVQAFGTAFQPNSLGDDVNQAVALPPGIRGLLARWERDVYV